VTSHLTDLRRDVEDFLYREAKMLDEQRYDEWLALFTEDVRYWMPITETREVRQPRDHVPGEWALMEEDSRFLAKRMERLAGGLAHAEQPRSRTRRFISNVLVTPGPDDDLVAECNFIVFQSRRANSEQFFVGSRRDRIVTSGESWKIAERTVLLDHRVLPRAISIFF
jgi:dibenzofuran dioxygenase beta subunit